jgi:hypothetical protein
LPRFERRLKGLKIITNIDERISRKTLVLRTTTDEASLAIGSVTFLQWLLFVPYRAADSVIQQPSDYLVDTVEWLVKRTVTGDLYKLSKRPKRWLLIPMFLLREWKRAIATGPVLVVALLFYGLAMAYFVLCALAMFFLCCLLTFLLLPLMIFQWVSQGGETALLSLITEVSVEPTPIGKWDLRVIEPPLPVWEDPVVGSYAWYLSITNKVPPRVVRGLRHSFLYEDSETIDLIIAWIRGRLGSGK